MSKALFTQRRDSRVAALQYIYAWSINEPRNLAEDLIVFFENMEQPRAHYAYAEELIQGIILNRIQPSVEELQTLFGHEDIDAPPSSAGRQAPSGDPSNRRPRDTHDGYHRPPVS